MLYFGRPLGSKTKGRYNDDDKDDVPRGHSFGRASGGKAKGKNTTIMTRRCISGPICY